MNMDNDKENLQLLSTFYLILGGITAAFACFPLIHVAVGIAMLTGAFHDAQNPPPPWFGLLFVIIGGLFVATGWALAILLILAGKRLRQFRSYTYCFVIACISCTMVPLGTILGIFSILVLSRPTAKALFTPSPGTRP